MIDLWLVASNTLWIAGLSLLLAALSWASWAAGVEGIRVGDALARLGARLVVSLGMAMFCAGLAATGRARGEVLLWVALAAGFGVYFILLAIGNPP